MSTSVTPVRAKTAYSGKTNSDAFPLLDEEFDIIDLTFSNDIGDEILADLLLEQDEYEPA